MLLYLIPSVTLQLHSLSNSYGDVTASQSHMQPSLRSTTLVYFSYVSHATVSESLTQQPSLHPLMLLSHSVRSRMLSHVSLVSRSRIVTRFSLPFSHATLSPNTNPSRNLCSVPHALTLSSSSNRSRNLYCSLSLTGRGQTRRSTRRHGLVFDRSWQSTIDPTTIWCTPIVNQGQRVRSAVKVSKM